MKRLLQLLAANRGVSGRKFEVVAKDNGTAEIFLYDAIVDTEAEAEWWGGVAPQSFIKELKALKAETIHLRINSPGGSVFAARAIEAALREHSATVIVHIDGLAASAATFIAMAGDQVLMADGAMFMIHKAWTGTWGNADELRDTANLLDKIDGTLAKTYADATGLTSDKCMEMMAAETWMTAQEALENGFVDSIGGEVDASAKWDLSAYDKAPGAAAGAGAPPAPAAKAPTLNDVRSMVESILAEKVAQHANELANRPNVAQLLRRLDAAALIP